MRNKYAEYWKVSRVIKSCNTHEQLVVAGKVATNFNKTFKDDLLEEYLVIKMQARDSELNRLQSAW